MKNLSLTILVTLFIGLVALREFKVNSLEPAHKLTEILSKQGYQNIKINNNNFSYCPRILEIPVRFEASLHEKVIQGIACFSLLISDNPRIQFKN